MILETPIQADKVENDVNNSIREYYAEYEATFVILHPFLKIKEGSSIKFETGNWPTKREIIQNTARLTWTEIINQTQLKDIKELDRLLAFLHCARRTADKEGWIKLMTIVDTNNYVVAQVDNYPDILTDITLELLKSFGYNNIFHYSDISDNKISYQIQGIIDNERGLPKSHTRILTPDNKILFETNFDERFTCLSSDRKTTNDIIEKLDLEGFYCNNKTKANWSYEEQNDNLIDWDSEERYKNYA
jgi:hypothetical protein